MRRVTSLILSSASVVAISASPAFAQAVPSSPGEATPEVAAESEQTPPSSEVTTAEGQPASEAGAIIVTGSRIRRDNYSTPQNVDVVTRTDTILAGTRSTAEVLQSATVTSGTSQIDGSFLGYISDNGQAASTVGLRGLGSQRTLVLLNGRRLAPAGVGAQLVAADLNVLPTSIVQRIEVLREGASSIYGSDAIAGVINIITDTKIDGITVDGFVSAPIEYGAGSTYRASVVGGKSFDRGHITAAFEWRKDDGLQLGDNPDWRCPRELISQNGVEIGQTTVDGTSLRCFPFVRSGIGTANGYGFLYNFNGTGPFFQRAAFNGYESGNPNITGLPVNVNNFDIRPEERPVSLEDTVFSPIKTYTAYVNGAYEIEALGDAELYGEGLFTRRKSTQQGHVQINFQRITNPSEAQLYGGSYAGVPLEYFGYPTSPFFPTAWAAGGYNYFGPFIVPDQTAKNKQKVDFWRANAGLRGNLGLGDWRYDFNVQLSRTKSRQDVQTPVTERMNNTIVAVVAPAGTPADYTVAAIPGQIGYGNTYTCAANVTNGAYNGGNCVPINIFDPAITAGGHLTDALFNYLYPMVNLTKTKFHQETYSFGVDGSIFTLPGGDAKMALGVEHRNDYIKDVPGAERQADTLYNYGSAGITEGSDKVNEAYAEISLPFFKNRPGISLLEVDASGRYTHYKSYGSGWTYHLAAQYAPVDMLRLRGNYGTNFRAPNLYEQFIADQIGFYAGGLDPCDQFGTRYQPGSTVYDNCLAALQPILGANAPNFQVTGGGIQVTTSGGRGVLKAEKAKTYGFGAVFTMPRHIADFTLAIDYWRVKVKGEVGTLGNLILNFCYNADDFPNNPYCGLIGPRLTVAEDAQHAGEITEFSNPYLNISKQIVKGIDFDARYATRLLGGKFSTQLQATRNLSQKLEYFPGQGLTEYNGTLGYPGFGSGPKWVGTLDTRFATDNGFTFRWGVKYIGPAHNDAPDLILNGEPVEFDLRAEPYWEHGASVQWQWHDVGQITFGVNNLLNEKPPTISDDNSSQPRIGNYFAGGAYDYRGRSFFINVTRTFKP